MTYSYSLPQGRFLIVPNRKNRSLYNLIWEDARGSVETILRATDGMTAFQSVITQETGKADWDALDPEFIPAEIYDFSLWQGHRSFSEDRSAQLQAC